MFSNRNICPSLQTAHISLHLCVSPCCCFHSDKALFSFLLQTFLPTKATLHRRADLFRLKILPSSTHSGGHACTGGDGTSSDARPCHRGALAHPALVRFAAYSQPSKNSRLVSWRGSRPSSDHFTWACGQTLNEMNIQRKG